MIVFCHLLNDRSGSPTVLRATLGALNAREDGLLFVGAQGRGVLEEAGVPTRRYWYRRSRYKIVTLFTFLVSQLALYRALSRARDIPAEAIVFVNTLLPFAAMLWGKRTGRRVVVHVHEASVSPGLLRRFLTECARRYASELLYVSQDHRDRLPIPGPKATVLPNPIAPALAERAARHEPHREGPFNVLMLTYPREYKGVGEFVALAQACADRHDLHFTIVLNAEEANTDAFARAHADMANLTVCPRTDDPASYYESAALVVNLTRVDLCVETFGLTLVEAMAFGLPVIAPPIGGPAEIVCNGVDGYSIDSRETGALRDAVTTLADDKTTYVAMSNAARKRAADFTFDAYAVALRGIVGTLERN